ncbi:MAG: hypothetical protein ACRELC_06065, partial [Gemmatimonadota bacterium]
MTDPKKSPIWQQQESLGATFMELWGWLWTASFGDVGDEYAAIRGGAGVSDLTPIQKWEFSGPEAFDALDRIHSNDLASMADEQVRYGALVDEDGAMVDDALVYRLSDDRWWLLTNSAALTGYFDQTVGHLDCRVEDFTDAFAVISI